MQGVKEPLQPQALAKLRRSSPTRRVIDKIKFYHSQHAAQSLISPQSATGANLGEWHTQLNTLHARGCSFSWYVPTILADRAFIHTHRGTFLAVMRRAIRAAQHSTESPPRDATRTYVFAKSIYQSECKESGVHIICVYTHCRRRLPSRPFFSPHSGEIGRRKFGRAVTAMSWQPIKLSLQIIVAAACLNYETLQSLSSSAAFFYWLGLLFMMSRIGAGGRISSGATLECSFAKKSAHADHNRRKPPHFICIAQYICFACGFVRFDVPT